MFYCYDTTTVIMDFLTRKQLRSILCLNKEFNQIKNENYYKCRILQNFFKRNRRLKCHLNRRFCYKVSKKELMKNKEKYIGKVIQFIIIPKPTTNISFCGHKHYIMWECVLLDTRNPSNLEDKGILVNHVGNVDFNVYQRCNCNSGRMSLGSNSDTYTFLNFKILFNLSFRILI